MVGKREKQAEKRKTSGLSVLRWALIVICVIVMICCGVYLARLALESRQIKQAANSAVTQFVQPGEMSAPALDHTADATESGEGSELALSSIDFTSLQNACPNAVGWIQVVGVDAIDYPIVHYSDDEYYLNHSWDGQSSRYGAIFMETANTRDFSDCYTLIYGHNMKDGSMFGGLKKYRDQSFYEQNGGQIIIYLPDETRIYQIFSVHVTSADDERVYTVGFAHDDTYGSFLETLRKQSLYDTGVSVSAEDNVITLSTCAGEDRLVVHAKQISTVPVA